VAELRLSGAIASPLWWWWWWWWAVQLVQFTGRWLVDCAVGTVISDSRLLVPQHGTIFLQAFDHWNLLNGNWRPTCSDLHINMYCRPSYNVLSILFLIVRRPWPNFVCKGRHTSSVVLVLLVLQWRRASVGGWMHQMLQLIEFKLVVLVFRCLHGMALPYLECELRRVPDTDSLWRLRSMSTTASTCSATDTSCYRW